MSHHICSNYAGMDWWGTFWPEPGYERFTGADGQAVDLVAAIVETDRQARAAIAVAVSEDTAARKQGRELLDCIDAGWDVTGC